MSPGLPPPGPIVVGVERSECSRDALALAGTLARASGCGLILVAVYPADARSATMERRPYLRALAKAAEAALEWAARPFSEIRVQSRAVACNSVARGLQQVAQSDAALAILIGSSQRSPIGRIVLGSVGRRLLHEASCSVAIAPRGYSEVASDRLARIGVGYVDKPKPPEALSAAVGLAARIGATVHALSVVEPAMLTVTATLPLGWGYPELEDNARGDLARGLQREIDRAAAPVEISGEVVDGYADDELARLSADVDLLVCGSRGRGTAGNLALGSVASGALRKSRCPVMVVPRGAGDGFAALSPGAAVA
jgi:nucleotide-binding universal stress UspA family protein